MKTGLAKTIPVLLFIALSLLLQKAYSHELSGNISAEINIFPDTALDYQQRYVSNLSVAAQLEYSYEWDNGNQSLVFIPFARVDQQDSRRSHFDIRELTWLYISENWELRSGIRKVFWGVAESVHLIDIINQTDFIENIDTEDKLGQPMINLALISDWGTLDLFALSGFRERTFPDQQGRLRFHPFVDGRSSQYESGAKQGHIDLAMRWSHTIGKWDIGLSHFYGTSRDPILKLQFDNDFKPFLSPFYEIINQTSLDLQVFDGDLLWKLEALYRNGNTQDFFAATGGVEYTFTGLFDTPYDLGLIAEYIFDDRPKNVPTAFQNDFIAGFRLTLNDVYDTQALFSISYDLENESKFINLEASRRINDDWKIELESRAFIDIPTQSSLYTLRRDSYIKFSISRFF